MNEDRDLRERFASLRRQQAGAAGDPRAAIDRARQRAGEAALARGTVGWALGLAAAGVAAAAVLWLAAPAPERADFPRDLHALGTLAAPTDALLGVAPLDLLGAEAPEHVPSPDLSTPSPVRESTATRRTLT